MVYLDTSVLAAYYFPEPLSEIAEDVILKEDNTCISKLTEVELASAVSRKVRETALSLQDANRIINEFQSHIKQSLFKNIPLGHDCFKIAYNWISRFDTTLKTLDALHLAVTKENQLKLITADKQLAISAEKLDIPFQLIAL